MKNIQESFLYTKSISESINESRVDEGLKDLLKTIKDKFKQAWEYLKGVVAKFGVYFLPVDKDGNVLPAISPLTAGQAYKDGFIKTVSTHVVLDKQGSRIVGLPRNYDGALALYGSGDSRAYWKRAVKECEDIKYLNSVNEDAVNEVKLQNSDPQAKYNVIVDDSKLKARIKMALKNKKKLLQKQELFVMLFHKCVHKLRCFRPVLAAPVFKIPLLHILVALIVDVIEDSFLHYKIGGVVVDIEIGSVEFFTHRLHLHQIFRLHGIIQNVAVNSISVNIFLQNPLLLPVRIQ